MRDSAADAQQHRCSLPLSQAQRTLTEEPRVRAAIEVALKRRA
jgi:hypothetical protein